MSAEKNILIVDDEVDIRVLLESVLFEYETDSASDVDEALEKLNEKSFDLIISDMRMPGGKSGEDLINILKERQINTPIIIMTGHMDSGSRVAELKKIAFDCLTKPFRINELMDVIEKALQA